MLGKYMKFSKKVMGLSPAVIVGKKLKEQSNQRKLAKASQLKASKPIKFNGEYFSSHPAIHGYKWLTLELTDDGVFVYGKKNTPSVKKFEWDEVIGYENEIEEKTNTQTTQRLTATRMATMGVFSLAAPKKQTHGYAKERFYDVLRTTTGDIELETLINGGGSGAVGDLSRSMAELFIMKRESKTKDIRRFVTEHMNQGTVQT
ncbi:hypothetical protein A3E76_02560 [Candidatus Saccharibacteria bacterium RIFCSPHIGHO2_12_FULL_44_22]|nr:MAG: hypothetical protein A3E76_02560 [Candidatus Saccharibacteria bacterium RIFCSPHIGHO2_12_FULL_44_22]